MRFDAVWGGAHGSVRPSSQKKAVMLTGWLLGGGIGTCGVSVPGE